MLQRAVALLLQRLLGKFVSFDSSMLRLSLWQGDLSFQDLQLRLSYGEGSIGHLSVKIPWRALWTQAVVIKAHNIRIFLHQAPKSGEDVLIGLVDDDSTVGNTSIDGADGGDIGDDRTYLSRLVAHIIANVQIELSDVQVRYDCTSASLAERPGSATLEVGFVNLINTNSKWELEFTPQSNASMESRKLLKIEGVAAYIEYEDRWRTGKPADGSDAQREVCREYLFHDWYSTVKASLFYHSSNASFPDVELDIDVGSGEPLIGESCSVCRACDSMEKGDLPVVQPRIHFGAEHIDVLYAILVEVKAPYEEYDRLAALTQQQASRPEGFLMVLAYAKQWLLSDCLDGVAGETYTLAGDSDDDDDDEFEDAITPPSLSIRAGLRQGVSLVFFSRESGDATAGARDRMWAWVLGHTWASVRQSCVEDELQFMIQSLKMLERSVSGQQYRIIDHIPSSAALESPFLFFNCIVPAYQSRLVGHQPVMDLQMKQKTVVALKDETLVLWMTLFAPVYLWWTQWNLSHPSKLIVHDEARIAPISNMSVDFENIQVLFSVHERFCFGIELIQLQGATGLSDDQKHVVSHFQSSAFRVFSAAQALEAIQSAKSLTQAGWLHEILVVDDMSLLKTSHSRTNWSVEAYACTHGASSDVTQHDHQQQSLMISSSNGEETAMYNYQLVLPAINIDWRIDEIEALSWVIGKWIFFLPDNTLDPSDKNLHLRSGRVLTRTLCNSRWSISVPELKLRIIEDRDGKYHRGMFELFIRDLRYENRRCSATSSQRITISAISLRGGEQTLFTIEGNARLSTPAVNVLNQVQRYYSEDAQDGDSSVLYFVGEVSETSVLLERTTVVLFLPLVEIVLKWLGSCYDRFNLGFILSTSYGYDFEHFRGNLVTLKSHASMANTEKSAGYHDETLVNVLMSQGCKISILHQPFQMEVTEGSQLSPVEIGAIECSSLSLQSRLQEVVQQIPEIKGTVRNLQVRDLAIPDDLPSETSVMPNRQFIGSNQSGVSESVDMGPFGLKNVVDFVMTSANDSEHEYSAENQDRQAYRTVVRVRLDSVCLIYLHRVFKQFQHYVADHVFAILADPFDHTPSSEKALDIFKSYEVNVSELPASIEDTLKVYFETFGGEIADGVISAKLVEKVYYELVANDLTFMLPRNSFSTDSIILHCTNARFWSAGVDSANSDFLQNGSFGDESRLSHSSAISDANMARAQQTRRTELRNVKRLVKNQRSRLLSNRSQLYIDLKNATQQAQNYLHEGFEAFPEAEEAVKIIHHKIVVLDQQLDQLTVYLKEVEDAIEVAKAEGDALNNGGRDSIVFMASAGLRGRTTSVVQSEAMDRIKDAVASMSQSLMTPLFIADNAEFHDARTTSDTMASSSAEVDMSTSSMGLFEFELVDLSGTTSNSKLPLFHHALLTGRIETELESLSEVNLSSYFGINLAVNELSVGASPEQYTTLLGAIYENFKEMSSIVDEDTYPLCKTCHGHHYDEEFCNAIWMRIPVKVADAALRVSNGEHSIADMFWEQLELVFILRTDDSLELNASALSFNAIDVRPTRCPTASEIIRPLPGDGLQVVYNQKSNWTDSVYSLKLNNTNCLLIYPAIQEAVAFFLNPIFREGEFFSSGVGFMGPTPPDWKKMDFHIDSDGCLLSLLEEFGKTDSRALVVLTDIALSYSTCQNCEDILDMKKCHFSLDQRGIYFSQLPDLQIDASFPLSNAFQLVVDHFVEGSKVLHRRNSFVLAPVETRFSVQDGYLFINIVNNYLHWFSSVGATAATSSQSGSENGENGHIVEKPVIRNDASATITKHYAVDKLLGDVGELRLVLVNNSLGIPIADFQMREIVCEYVQDEECSTVVGGILSFNYFNNSIYRWEPLVEPFVVQVRVHRALEENSRVEVFANLPNTVNFNITPAMAPLLSTEALKQADFVTTGSKSTAPFWIQNNTGMDIKFSFRRGKGNIIQQDVPNDLKVSVDCRERGDMRSFDSTSADRFLRDADRNALTVNHTLSVWLNGNKWVSANPVVVDVVGHVSVPLREVINLHGRESLNDGAEIEEDLSPPILVAEITIQPDGSKLISLHSQIVLQNRTSVPLMVWAFSPRDGGCVQEWVIDREQLCHVPLKLIHPQSKISIRPSPYVQYAPLATSLEELGDEVRVVKSINTKRFIRSGNCVCNFETFATPEELRNATNYMTRAGNSFDTAPLSGYVVRDLPTWKCTYDVEAYYLMRATFSAIDETKLGGEDSNDNLTSVDEEEQNEKVEDDFRNVFSDENLRKRVNHPLSEVNYELDEARNNNQRRGLYEATNSSLFYLSVSPFVTLHNRLATAVAYRLLNGSLQLIAEGILAVGNVLPLFQVDSSSLLYISFRLENYNWSTPKVVINPKSSAYSVPYKDLIEPVELQGRIFDRDVAWEQGNVPNLQLQVKLSGRDVIIFCSVWIVNHSDLDLEYCNSTSSSNKRLESVLKYVHRRHTEDAEQNAIFSTRNLSFHDDGARDQAMTRLQKVKAASNPVALIVVIKEAKDLYNAQYFGAQSPYVRASLYVLKNPQDRYLDRPEMQAVCTATTKPSPSGGLNPKWDARLQNTLLLRFPENVKSLELARVIVEVRNVRYGMDTCLGVTAVKLNSITKDRKSAASFNWYKLLKRKSSKGGKGKKAAQTSVHRGDVCLSFSVGSSQEVRSELDAADIIYEVDEDHRSPSIYDEERPSLMSPHDGEFYDITDEDASAIETQTPGTFPSSAMFRSMHRLQTPASESAFLPSGAMSGGDLIVGPPGSIRARQGFPLSDLDSTRTQQDMVSFDPLSTRSISGNTLNGGGQNTSPRSISMPNLRPLQVYLPQNRFAFVVVNVHPSFLLSEIFELVCLKCGFHGVLDVNDFDFYELALPRFVSLRSAGRPEGDRWYGHRIPMESKVEKHGRQYGLHLCHKMTMTTIRLYDESSTASTHHVTPRSLLSSSKKTNPAQNRPMAWGEVLAYGSGGKNWDVLRVKSQSSPWSEVIRLNRNAMGNSGVAQVFSLANEVYDQDQTSDLRKGNQEIALWSSYGTGRFSDTIIATIVPRYILINRTGQTVKYRQLNVPHTFRLGSNDIIPFHWPSASKDKLMEVTLLHGYTWSGSFRIHSIGTTYLKLRDSNDLSRIYILQCQIEMVGGSIALVFREESKRFPPYRIDNMTSFRIQYKQTNWGSDRDFDELQPRSSCPYSWDQLNGGEKASSSASYQDPAFSGNAMNYARSLQVRFMRVTSSTSAEGDSEKDAVETRDYNLDEMTSHRRIQLQRSLPSQLFINPEHKGYLLKKDNLLKWNKKYFRLYENMLYYFANENDQELLGVVDLRTGSDVPGAGSVAIFEKAADTQSKGGFMSLNGLVSSISGTIFGSSSRQLAGDDDDGDNDDEDERARDLVQLAVGMTTSTALCEKSDKFVERVFEDEDGARSGLARKGFYVNGESVIAFLVGDSDRMTASQAFSTAQEMLILGVLKVVQMGSSLTDSKKPLASSSFRSSKSVWYSVNSISLADDTDSIDSEDDTPQNGLRTPSSVKTPSSAAKKKPKKVVGSAQFSIITATKCYDLKAKTPRIAKLWVKRLRNAARGQQNTIGEEELDEAPTSMINSGPKAHRAQKDIVPIVQHAKTYVHVRIRADGPTKVLEIFEGGEEDFDEKESKHELSSAASAASESPTASETSTNAFEALTNGISINLRVDSLGISCVNELPMELVYIYFAGINVHYTRVNSKMRLNMTLDDVQVDNQSSEATFNKLLCPRTNGASAATTERKRTISDTPDDDLASMIGERVAIDEENENGGLVANEHMFSCADCKYRQLNVATTHFCCTWSNEQGTTDYFEHCSFWLHPVISQLDEELLVAARAFLTAMMQSLSQNKAQSRGGEIRAKSIPIEMMTESLVEYKENTMSDDLNPLVSLHSSTATSSTEVRKVYFALLHIHPIEFDITYRSDVFQAKIPSLLARDTSSFKSNHSSTSFLREEYSRTASVPASSGGLPRFEFDRPNMLEDTQKSGVAWAIPSLTMHVPDLDNAPVRLNALMIEHAFGTSGDLTRRVSKYYTRQLWKQLHKILGSFDFLGNPVGFLDHIGTGVRDFVYEPLEGLKVGGKGFSKGLAKGTASLVTNTLDGTFDAASKISGTFGQGLATMSLDDHYQQIRARARRHHVRGIREGLIQGSKELSLGMYEGVAGLVLGPMRGAQENGALGFVKGTITGIIGLPVKPVAGIFDFASRATQGVRNRSLQNGQNMRRVRRPRVFGRYNELKCYKEADTIAYDLLKKTGGAKLSGEKIIFYNEVIQSVLASELTKQARDKRKNDSTRERTRSFRRSLNDNEEKLVDGKQGSERKLIYEVTFYQKKLGLDLETDFYCENVTVKAFDESSRHHTKVHTTLRADQKVLQEGDCLITVGGVDVRGIGFEETLALLRGTSRPIKLQFESCDEQIYESNNSNVAQEQQQEIVPARARTGSTAIATADRDEENGARLKVQLTHWLIVTEQRALYINVSSFVNPIVEWMTPLRYIYRVEWLRGSRICLHLSVGVDSLPTGPRSRPSLRALDGHERDMNVFLDVMWQSFKTATAEEQELWPSDTSLNGFLMKKGGFTTVKRWFVLSRNCLYYFSSQKELRGIIPLGSVRLEADSSAALSIRITNEVRNKPLVTLQMDNGQVVARVQSEIVLLASSRQDFEMWQSSLAHAAGKGLRNSRGTRFFVPTAASRLEVGTRDTPDFVVAPLAEALKKTVEMFNIKLP